MVTIQLDMQYSQSDVLSGHPSNTSVQLKGFVIKSIDPITFVYSHAVVDILLCYPRVIQSNVWHNPSTINQMAQLIEKETTVLSP